MILNLTPFAVFVLVNFISPAFYGEVWDLPKTPYVLGGALSPIDGVDPEDLKIEQLVARVGDGDVREVVLATNPTTTGEATALHIAERLRGEARITRLASGLPVGADLEHADEVTLGRALAGRRSVED